MVSSVAPSAARRTFSKPKQTWGLQHQSGYSSPRPYIPDSFAASSPRASLSPSASTRGPLRAASSLSAANYLSGIGSSQRLSRPADCVTLGQTPPVGGLENGLRGRSLRRTSQRAKQATVREGPQQMSPVMSPSLACRADAILPPATTSAQRQYRPSTRNLVPSSQQRRGTVGQSRAWTLKQLSQSGASTAHSSSATMQPAREVHLPFQSSLPLPGVSAPTIPMGYQPRQTVPLDAATQRSLSPPFFGLRQEQPLLQRSYDFSLLNDALNGKEPSYSSSAPSFSLPQQRRYSSGYSIQLPVQVGQATPPHMGSPVGVFGPIAAQSPRDYALDHQAVNRSPRATFPSSGILPTRDSHCNVFRQFSAPPLSHVVVSSPSQVQRSVSYHPSSSIKRMCSASPVVSREASAERPFSTLAQRAVVISTSEAACSQELSKLQTTRTFVQTKKATEFTHSVQRQASSPPAYPAKGIHQASPKKSSPDSQLRVVQRQFSAPPLRSEYATWILGGTSQLSTPNCSGAGGKLQPSGLYDAHGQKIFVAPATEQTQPKMKASPLPMAYRSANIDLLEAQTPQPAAKDDLLGNEPTNAIPAKLDCGKNEDVKERAFRIGSHSVAGRHPPFQWTNQDEHVVIQLADHLLLAAVFDGHGQTGHLISSFVKQVFEQYATDLVVTQGLEPHDALLCLFRVAHQGLKGERELAWVSGSTASAVIIDAKSGLMTSAHAGDSRVLLVDGSGIVFETVDHVITAADEERMLASGGEVREVEHCGITSRRIFVRGQNHPGLAMARSLGDLQAQSVGTLSDPEIHQNIPIGRRSTVVVATDGIWEKLSTNEVREFLAESDQDLQQAAVSLVDRASARWMVQTDVDDITAVLIRMPVLDYDIGDTGGTGEVSHEIGEISVLDIPNAAPIGTALGNGTDDNNVTNSSLLDSPDTLLRAQEVAEFMQHGVVPIDASMASIHETALLVQSIGEALGTGISQADGFLSRSDLQATEWIEMDGLPEYEGEDINIATLGLLSLEQIKAVCESNPDCVGFAYCTAGNGRWCPKKIGTGFHPLVATYSQKHPGEFWKWYYISDRIEALGDYVTQERDFATVQLASDSSFTPIAASESSSIPKPPVITTEAHSLDVPRLHTFTFDTTQSTSPNSIDAIFTFDATDKEEHVLPNSTLAAVATAAMTQPQPHDSPRVDAKQFQEVDIHSVPAPTSWRDLTPTGPVRSLLAPGPFLDDDGTAPVLAPFPSPVPVGAAPKFTSGAGMPSLAAVAMATVTPNPSPLVNTSVTPVPVPRKLESCPQTVSSPSGWENAVDAAAVRSPSWSMQNKAKQAESLSSQFVQQVPADGVRQAPSPVDELQWRRWVTGVGTPPRV